MLKLYWISVFICLFLFFSAIWSILLCTSDPEKSNEQFYVVVQEYALKIILNQDMDFMCS